MKQAQKRNLPSGANGTKKQNDAALQAAAEAADMAIGDLIDLAVSIDEQDNRGDRYTSCIAELESAFERIRKAAARYDVMRGWYRPAT